MASCCLFAAFAAAANETTLDVPAGKMVKVEPGRLFEGGTLVKTGAGCLDLTGARLRNAGLEVREGTALFVGGGATVVTTRYLKWHVTKTRPAKGGPPDYGGSGSQFSEFRLFRDGKMLPRPPRATALNGRPGWREGPQMGIDGDLTTKCYFNPFIADFGEEVTLDGFWLKRGEGHNLVKSEAGDIIVTNCVSSDASGQSNGHGGYLIGSSETVARFANVRFSNLFGGERYGDNKGTALYLDTFSRVYIDGGTFSTNGCSFSCGFDNSMYEQDGAALFAKNAPLTVRGTRFLANRSQILNYGNVERGGVVRVTGSCGATAFTNCLFVGNEVVHGYWSITEIKSDTGGMLAASPSSGTVDIVNCTFAMGLASITYGPAAVAVRSGTVNVLNSIFYGNTNCAWNTAGFDIHVAAGATANVSHCLFEDDSAGRIVCAEGGTANLATSTFVYGNPLFVTDTAPSSFLKTLSSFGESILLNESKIGELTAFNAHLRGGLGYFDEATGAIVKAYARGVKSPAVDMGDPNSDFSKEPAAYSGRRANLGYYGNTPWATMTQPAGMVLYLR